MVLGLKLRQLLDERLDLGASPPLARVEPVEDALPRLLRLRVLDAVLREVDAEGRVAGRAVGFLFGGGLEELADALAAEAVRPPNVSIEPPPERAVRTSRRTCDGSER